jgi:hypothetical protein
MINEKLEEEGFEKEMASIYAAKEELSAEINRIPPEKRIGFLKGEAEKVLKECGLKVRRPSWYKAPTFE